MTGRSTACASVVLVALVGFGCAGAPPIELVPGEEISLAYKEIQGLTYKGKSFTASNYQGFARDGMTESEYTTSVDSIYANGTVVRSLKFDRYTMVTYSGSQAIFDPEAKMIEGENLWLKVKSTGEIEDWRGLEGVRSYTEDRNAKQTIVQGMALSFLTVPTGPVSVGDTWTQQVDMPINMRQGVLNFTVTNTYELLGLAMKDGHKCAQIGTVAEIIGDGEGGDEATQFKFNISVEGEGKGEVFFGIDEGYLIRSYQEVNVETEQTSVRGREEPRTEHWSAKVESEVVLVE